MKKMKIRFDIAVLVVVILCAQSMAVYASPIEDTAVDSIVSPCYEYTSSAIADLSISSGNATVSGSLIGYSGITDNVKMYLYLQKNENGIWKTVDTFYESFSNYKGKIEETVSVDAGYSYRVKGSYYAYDGSESEHITRYSTTVEY